MKANKNYIASVHVVKSRTPNSYHVTWREAYKNKPSISTYSDQSTWFIEGNKGISGFIGHGHQSGNIHTGMSLLSFKDNNSLTVKVKDYYLTKDGTVTKDKERYDCKKTKPTKVDVFHIN